MNIIHNGIKIRIKGKVQGVGFRPFVWQLANELGLYGDVSNDSHGVIIHLWHDHTAIQTFIEKLKLNCPPLAQINSITTEDFYWNTKPFQFSILASKQGEIDTLIVPDVTTCPICLQELNDPHNRRFHYPFINCTHCGPRFTIIENMPYDRPNTTMSQFALCAACKKEYESPDNRRFHAQPTACENCGPQIWACSANGHPVAKKDEALDFIVQKIQSGNIIAIKGIGGFHLVCDALQDEPIHNLRLKKNRQHKPLAVMLPDENWLPKCVCSDVDFVELVKLLKSPAAPIVLVPTNLNSPISKYVAPDLNEIGIMLPSNPLHHLLLKKNQKPLVMTSGNANNQPPTLSNQEALSNLKEISDYWLLHDRNIVQRADDSVLRMNKNETETLRRAKGYVPDVVNLSDDFNQQLTLLAMGSDRKNTFCLLKSSQAFVSQHLGNLSVLKIQQQYQMTLDLWLNIYQPNLDLIVVDAHPDYLSHQIGLNYSKQYNIPLLAVYHHHAHIAACLAEHSYPLQNKPVIGIVLDGLGYGQNGSLWGGECLIANYKTYQYFGGLPAVPLPGGDLASKEPWRNLLAHFITFVPNWQLKDETKNIPIKNRKLIIKAIKKGINSPVASSAGRLFDAIAAALGISPEKISWEGEAACKLESLANQYKGAQFDFPMNLNEDMTLNLSDFWQQWLMFKATPEKRAYAFHAALADGMAKLAKMASLKHHLNTIVLSGGVMQNQLLRKLIQQALPNYDLLFPKHFPANDGGIALGQAAIAAAIYKAKIQINK